MVKILFMILFTTILFGDIFDENCLKCHQNKKELRLFMNKYTLKYSSERRVKKALFRFLKYPSSNKSIMPYSFIIKSGFKDDSNLSDTQLKEAIDIYYNRYNLRHFIR